MNKVVLTVSLLCFSFLNPVLAASGAVTLPELSGSWTVAVDNTINVTKVGVAHSKGTAVCNFAPDSSAEGHFICFDNNGQPVVNGTLTLSKNGKKLQLALGADTLDAFEAALKTFILAKVSSEGLAIDESTLTVDIKKTTYTPIKVKSPSSLGPEHITMIGKARALVNGRTRHTGLTFVINLRFTKQAQ